MPVKPRFVRPADNRRPYGSHRFDGWSPKLRRRITLFGKRAFSAWLAIESDPDIVMFCERPLVPKGGRHNRVVDFWVQRPTTEEIWILLRASELQGINAAEPTFPGLEARARTSQIRTRYIRPEDELLNELAMTNWRRMLNYIAANRDLISKPLLDRLQAAGLPGRSIGDLEREFDKDDPVLIRSGIFSLIHRGGLVAADLVHAPIGPSTRVVGP